MWRYQQSTGIYQDKTGLTLCLGYSGHGIGKNNPAYQRMKNLGPIPRGFYSIGKSFDSDTHGPFCLRLTPFPENEMFGRDGFLIHGDSKANPGMASEGCICLPHNARVRISESGDEILEVVA